MLRKVSSSAPKNSIRNPLEAEKNQNIFTISNTVITNILPSHTEYVLVNDDCQSQDQSTLALKFCQPVASIYTLDKDNYVPITSIFLVTDKDDRSDHPTTPALTCASDSYNPDGWTCYAAWIHWSNQGIYSVKYNKFFYADIRIVKFNQTQILNEIQLSDIEEYAGSSIVNGRCFTNCAPSNEEICSSVPDDNVYIHNQPYSLALKEVDSSLFLTTTLLFSMIKDNQTSLMVRYSALFNPLFNLSNSYLQCDGKQININSVSIPSAFNMVKSGQAMYGVPLTDTVSFKDNLITAYYTAYDKHINLLCLNHAYPQQSFFGWHWGPSNGERYNVKMAVYQNRIIIAFELLSNSNTYQTFIDQVTVRCAAPSDLSTCHVNALESPLMVSSITDSEYNHCINPALAISNAGIMAVTCSKYDVKNNINLGMMLKLYDFSEIDPFNITHHATFLPYETATSFEEAAYGSASIVCLERNEYVINFIDSNGKVVVKPLSNHPNNSSCNLTLKILCGYSDLEIASVALLIIGGLSVVYVSVFFRKDLFSYLYKKYNEYKGYFEVNNPSLEDDDIEMGNVSQKISLNNLIVGEKKYQLFSANQREFIKYFVLEFEKTLNFYDVIMRSDVTQYDANSEKWKTLTQAIASSHLEFPVPGFDSSYIPFKMNLPTNVIVNMIFSSIALLKNAYNVNQAKEVNKAFQHLSLRERIKFIYRTARFLSVYYFNKINPCKSGEQVKQSVNDAIKIIFERLLKNNMLKYCFYSYSQTVIDIDHEIKEAFPLKFSKTSNQEIFTYFEEFLQGEATADLDNSIDNQQENIITVLSKALSDEDFCRYLIDKNESELADSDKLKKYVIFTGNKLIKGGSITLEFIEALFLIDPQSCQRIDRENSLALPPDNIRRFINNFTKLFYNTYVLYSCLDAKTIRKKAAISREQKGAAMQAIAKAIMPVIHVSGNEMGVPLPIEISLSTGIVMAAIISLYEKMQKKSEKKKNRSVVHFFDEKNLQNRVDDIYDCAAFLSVAYYTYLRSLKDNEQITLFSAFTVEKIFRYIGKERNKSKLFIEGNSVDLKHVAVCVIQRSIKKENKQDKKQPRFVGIFKNPTAQYAHPSFDYTKFKIL